MDGVMSPTGMETTEVLCVKCSQDDAEPEMPACLDCAEVLGYLDDECPVHRWSAQICGGDCDLATLHW